MLREPDSQRIGIFNSLSMGDEVRDFIFVLHGVSFNISEKELAGKIREISPIYHS